MDRIEVLAVELDEAKRLLELGSVPHVRLAFILIDNVIELTMHRMIERYLTSSRMWERIAEGWNGLDRNTEEKRRSLMEAQEKIIPRRQQKEIARFFDPKVEFLVDRGDLPSTLAAAIRKLHFYRNEVYHRDLIRLETILPATILYFSLACTLFTAYRPTSIATGGRDSYPGLSRFVSAEEAERHPESWDGFDLPERIGRQLREELGLNAAAIRATLVDHVRSRLDEILSSLDYIQEACYIDGLTQADALRLVQADALDFEDPLNSLRARNYTYTLDDISRWKGEAEALSNTTDEVELFANFARVEDEFEPLEALVAEEAAQADLAIEHQIDMMRGK